MKLLATNHFTSRFTSSNGGLPMFTNKTNTFVSASQMQNQGLNRYPTVTETTTTRKGTGILRKLSESKDGIQVKKEFEMSVITHSSKDSIDQLENEVDEVISPGTARSGSLHSRGHSYQQSLRLNPSPRLSPAPSRPTLQDAPILMPSTAITGPPTSHATNGYSTYSGWQPSASPQSSRSASAARKGSFGQVSTPFGGVPVDQPNLELRSPPPIFTEAPRHSHHSTNSQDSSRSNRTPRSTATSFHLPTRMQHYSVASSASGHSRSSTSTKANSRGTFGADGLPQPSRMTESGYGDYTPDINNNNPPASLPGSPEVNSASRSIYHSPISQLPNSSGTIRFPFEKPNTIPESKTKNKRSTRVSAFLADNSSVSSAETGDCSDEELTGTRPQWAGQGREAPPSPLTSHPPLSPRENWV